MMQATPGDRLIVYGNLRGDPGRSAEILEVRGPDGGPPYVVRWADGRESLFFPGPNAVIKQTKTATPPDRQR